MGSERYRAAAAILAGVVLFFQPPVVQAVTVSSAAGLEAAVAAANGGGDKTILLENGTYRLSGMLWVATDNLRVRGLSGNRQAVIIEGDGMSGGITHVFNVAGSGFTVEDLTLRRVSRHALQLQVDVDDVTVRNVRFEDTGEQMLKVAYDPARPSLASDRGLVEGCHFEYTAGIGPQWYIGGVDAHNARGWIVRDNIFAGIRSPGGAVAEFAIHFWSDSADTVVERNLIKNCDRGIGFGLGDRGHQRGVIRNNMLYHDASEGFADTGIALESSPGTLVYNNTIFHEHSYPNAIEYRFSATTDVEITNNLTNRAVSSRDGGAATLRANMVNAESSWFADAPAGDLHIARPEVAAVDGGVTVMNLTNDFDKEVRPLGAGVDVGADEYAPRRPPAPMIRANGSSGPVVLARGEKVQVTISLDAGDSEGKSCEWWLAARAEIDGQHQWYSYRHAGRWLAGLRPARKSPLFGVDKKTVMEGRLPPGRYRIYFGVDMRADGQPGSPLYQESVVIESLP